MKDVVKAIRTVHVLGTGNVVCIVRIENVIIPIKRIIDVYCCKIIGIIEKHVNKNHIAIHDICTCVWKNFSRWINKINIIDRRKMLVKRIISRINWAK